MAGPHFNADTLLLVIPMVVMLFVAAFRLDELLSRSPKIRTSGRRLNSWDENGIPLCADPGSTEYTAAGRTY